MSHSRQNTNPYFGGDCGRSPHGERGLKSFHGSTKETALPSLPSRGAWIEIGTEIKHITMFDRRSPHGERGLKFPRHRHLADRQWSLPSRGAWIEITKPPHHYFTIMSLPSRGAWIEISVSTPFVYFARVAPLTGSVD